MLDIAIIGGGPAGLAAGLYAARGGANVALFESLFTGGQAVKTHQIDNYPAFTDGIEGFELGTKLEQHATKFGLSVQYAEVSALDLTGEIKRIVLADGTEIEARTIILAMGAKPRMIGVEREAELTGSGVSYCATCDGAFFRDKPVAVVGGGDTAISDALYLARFASRVYVVHRRDQLRATKVLQESAFREEKIEFVWNSTAKELLGEKSVEGLVVTDKLTGEDRTLEVAAVFAAVGIVPESGLAASQLVLDASGAIVTDAKMHTSESGVYAAGDVRNTPLRQVITACADGAVAATEALEYIATTDAPIIIEG